MVYLNHRKDDTRCTDKHQELGLKEEKSESKMADLRKEQKIKVPTSRTTRLRGKEEKRSVKGNRKN